MGNGEQRKGRQRPYPQWLRRLLGWWWGLIAFIALALVGNILLLPLSQGFDHLGENIGNQIAALIGLVRGNPVPVLLVGALVALVTIEAYRVHAELEREKQPPAPPPSAPLTVPPPNVAAPRGLPLPPALIGRDAELATLMNQLRDGENVGVFALEGIGGVGKTALAAVAVARLAQDTAAFPGGAAWIACEGLAGPEGLSEVWARVAEALNIAGIAEEPSEPARRALLSKALAQCPRTLLALDNVEPDLSRALKLASGEQRPGLEVLLEALALAGHTAVLFTARQGLPHDRLMPIYLDVLSDEDAAKLFASILAREGKPQGARPTPDDQARIPAVVAAVGGLPLAITLAATYTARRGLTLETLQHELEQDGLRAGALKDPHRGVAVRFARSYGILTPAQQRLFAGLSLLAGASFPRAAALAVASAGFTNRLNGLPQEELPADNLDRLVEYALVEALPGERLRLHPLLREYAEECLREVGPQVEARLGDALLRYWIDFAVAHPGYEGMYALEAEAEGLMGVMAWARAHGRYVELVRLVTALGAAWDRRGRRADEVRMYSWAEEAAGHLDDRRLQWWAIHQLAVTYSQIGRLEEGRAGYERALALARELGDKRAEQAELHELAVLDGRTGRTKEAREGFERALELARELGIKRAEQAAVHGLAVTAFIARDLQGALDGYREALRLAQEMNDPAAEAVELRNLGDTLRYFGQLGEAREMLERSMEICESQGNLYEIGKGHEFLGRLEEQEGHYEAALAHFREALRLLEQVQSPDAEEVRDQMARVAAKGGGE